MGGIGFLGVALREAPHFVNQHGVALLGDKQALAHRIVGQAFKALVARRVDPQRQLLGIAGIQNPGVVIDLDLDQALLTLIGNHIGIFTNKLHRFGITKPDQCDTAQDLAIKGKFDQLGFLVGYSEQAFTNRVEGQCRNIVLEPFDGLALQYRAVLAQIDRIRVDRLPLLAEVKPDAFRHPEMLRSHPASQ